MKKTLLVSLLLSIIGFSNISYAEESIENIKLIEKREPQIIVPLSTDESKRQPKVIVPHNYEKKVVNIIKPLEIKENKKEEVNIEDKIIKEMLEQTPIMLSEGKIDGFYNYEDYLEYRDKVDPKKEKNDLFNGVIVNTKDGDFILDQDKYRNFSEENLTSLKKEEKENFSEEIKDLYKYRLYGDLQKMTGFSLFNELKDFDNTYFLFLDFNYEKDKIENFMSVLFNYLKENNKNLIIYPLAFLEEDSERLAFNWLKTFSLGKPEEVLKLSDKDFYKTFKILKVKDFIAQRLVDGIVSNNLIYGKQMGVSNPFTLLRLNVENEGNKYLMTHDFLSKEELEKFGN